MQRAKDSFTQKYLSGQALSAIVNKFQFFLQFYLWRHLGSDTYGIIGNQKAELLISKDGIGMPDVAAALNMLAGRSLHRLHHAIKQTARRCAATRRDTTLLHLANARRAPDTEQDCGDTLGICHYRMSADPVWHWQAAIKPATQSPHRFRIGLRLRQEGKRMVEGNRSITLWVFDRSSAVAVSGPSYAKWASTLCRRQEVRKL